MLRKNFVFLHVKYKIANNDGGNERYLGGGKKEDSLG